MRKYIAIFLLALLPLLAGGRPQGDNKLPLRPMTDSKLPFAPGEKLTYVVHYKWGMINSDVAKGYLTFDTVSVDGKRLYNAKISGRTAKFYDPFFKVRENLDSWLSTDGSFTPQRYRRDTKEGGYILKSEFDYMWGSKDGDIVRGNVVKKKGSKFIEEPIRPGMIDLPTALYIVRCMDFSRMKEDDSFPLEIYLDGKIVNISITYKCKEQKYVKGLGNVKTFKVSLSLFDDEAFNAGDDLFLWLSDDANRVPLLFSSPIKFGLVTGYLESYKGLKNPFNSIIKR